MSFTAKYNKMKKLEKILEDNFTVDSKYIRECRNKYCRLLDELMRGEY